MLEFVLVNAEDDKLVFNLTLDCADNIIFLFVFEVLSLRNIGDFHFKLAHFS